MKLLGGVCVVLVVFSELTTVTRGDLMSVFTYDYLVGLNLTERWSGGSIPDLVLDQILDLYAPVSSAVDNPLCRNHSLDYKQAVKDKKLWALYMLESSALVPNGLMTGNTMQLGNYEGCMEAEGVRVASGHFSGQHCTVSLTDGEVSTNESVMVVMEGLLEGLLLVPGLKWSVCIPSSCTPRDLEAHLRSALQGVIGDVTVTVADNACHTKEQNTQLTPGDWFAIVFLALFALITILSTAYDLVYSKSDSRSELFASFSLYTNGRKLLTPSTGGGTLQAVHGIRTLSMLCIVLGHIYESALFDLPALNYLHVQGWHDDLIHLGVKNYRLAVDTFFLLSGLLVCYIFMREREKGESFNIPLYYLHRYIRLTPAFAVMMLLTATLLGHAGDGPLWEEEGQKGQEYCIQNWWINIIYLSNYIRPLEGCLDQTWYLSADMQLYLLSPLILIPLWKWPRRWKAVVAVPIFAGVLISLVVSFIFEIGVDPDPEVLNVMWYLPTHMRFMPWVIGIGLGYMLHKTKGKPLTLSRRTVVIGWLLCAVFLVGPLFANKNIQDNVDENRVWLHALNLTFNKPVFTFSLAWIVFACAQGYGGPINTFLSWSVFEVLGRLTYTVYLLHTYFVRAYAGTLRTSPYLSDRTLLMFFAGVVVMSFFAAMLLSLVFEAPALIIEKLLLGRGGAEKRNGRNYNVEKLTSEEIPDGVTLVSILDADTKR